MSSAKTNRPKKTEPTFEHAMERLEKLAESMEQDSLTLEESLQAFEDGIKLTRETQKALAEAEQKVSLLIENDGQPVVKTLPETDEL